MHNAAFKALGLDWAYELLDIPPEALPSAVARLRGPEVAGANVTIPHKLAVMERLDRLDADALRASARRLGRKLARRLMGYPATSEETLDR